MKLTAVALEHRIGKFTNGRSVSDMAFALGLRLITQSDHRTGPYPIALLG